MATILRFTDKSHGPHATAFNLDDLAVQADQYLTEVQAEAAQIVAEANEQADSVRRQAVEQGRQMGVEAVEKIVAQQLAPALAALQQTNRDLQQTKQAWLSHWEAAAVRLAVAIAARVVRQELRQHPEITLTLVREALELAAGSSGVRLRLNPEDYESLGTQVKTLIDGISSLGEAEVTADAAISRGGCRVETRFGTIDQQFESQLKRIEEELTV